MIFVLLINPWYVSNADLKLTLYRSPIILYSNENKYTLQKYYFEVNIYYFVILITIPSSKLQLNNVLTNCNKSIFFLNRRVHRNSLENDYQKSEY